ncbi:HMA domain-containing protein [Cephalotus follicularis]|uniref:HMA domain-containing protein n=1 Tax=Cephalotus follicularis TaxID=3775 RepID=A0A1Q3DER8_CEPFO|nr:HMA domain-containing protein [Cephalotus follicularis]
MVQRTVLKVEISCEKCKKQLLKAVSALQGVDKIEIDAAKGTLTVTGDADPYEIIVRARKVGKFAEVISIGPPPKQDAKKKPEENKPKEKKSEDKEQEQHAQLCHTPHCCPICQQMGMVQVARYDEPNMPCTIM